MGLTGAVNVHPRYQDQVQREAAQRDIALGRRIESLTTDQHTGTIVKRWVNASVIPLAERLRGVAKAYLDGETAEVIKLLDSPVFGLVELSGDGHADLVPIFQWLLKGSSPGRSLGTTTYAEDLVLAGMGTALELLVKGGKKDEATGGRGGVTLAQVISRVGDAMRETCMGQFLTQVQGADAMQAVRRRDRSSWAQADKLNAVAAMMGGQVRAVLESEARGEIDLEKVGSRKVLKVMQPVRDREGVTTLKERRLSLRPPEAGDYELLKMASRPKGERDPHRQAWQSMAMLLLCAAQVEAGWFDVATKPHTVGAARKSRWKPAKVLVLSARARAAVEGDLQRWLASSGIQMEPMVCPPEEGDYLTVKHKGVTGKQGPMGLRTEAGGSRSFAAACDVMASTAWSVSPVLAAIRDDPRVAALAEADEEDAGRRATILAGYRRVAAEEAFWLPIQLDFRGRQYPKTTWVTYQGTDLQKGLMCFPAYEGTPGDATQVMDTLALHTAALYGHGLDKAPLSERLEWYQSQALTRDPVLVASEAEEPLALLGALQLIHQRQSDRVAVQIDGTCNGLQHLSALFRDHRAAPWVNLVASTREDRPSDLYVRVAEGVTRQLGDMGWTPYWDRLHRASVQVNRKLAKKPVMVLPYGGTLMTIQESVTDAVLSQSPDAGPWHHADGYAPFAGRDLSEHPLFKADCRELGRLTYDAIREVIPLAMSAMDAFRKIARKVGARSLEWRVGPNEDDLWVVHAYSVSAQSRTTLKGFHLPNSVRSLAMRVGRDEIDKGKHASGIVANFIHSMDSVHLARTERRFEELGGTSFGAIHDCLLGRPSEMHLMNRAVREAFKELYEDDPLSFPVRMREPKTGDLEEYPSWYALAEAVGVPLPEKGDWKPEEVLDSAWFFS